ncbi:MAG: hypothetical protein IJK59_05205 [Firmicutes bacterium]|nr:hypothetical protein [Bacillota bacterium]
MLFGRRIERETSLADVLTDWLDCFSSDTISAETMRRPLRLLRACGWLEDETLRLLEPLDLAYDVTSFEFLRDGTVRYTAPLLDPGRSLGDEPMEALRMDPVKTAAWAFRLLQEDRKLQEKLGFRPGDLGELISAASRIDVSDYIRIEDSLSPVGENVLLCGNGILLWTTNKMRARALELAEADAMQYASIRSAGEELASGLGDEVFRNGSSFYFRYNGACAYLHLDLDTAESEILQNVEILGFAGGRLIYRDVETEEICAGVGEDRKVLSPAKNGETAKPCGEYVLIYRKDCSITPFRAYPDGKRKAASGGELSRLFWETVFSRGLAPVPLLAKNMDVWEILKAAEETDLSIEGMRRIHGMICERKLLKKKTVFPMRDLLDILERAGAGASDDLSSEMFTLLYYNELHADQMMFFDPVFLFTPAFCGLLKRMSRKKGFLARLKNDPEGLFEGRVTKAEEPVTLDDILLADPGYIGTFTVHDDESIPVRKKNKSMGKVSGTEIVYDPGAGDEGGRSGSLAFDLETGQYVLHWEEDDPELTYKIATLFCHSAADVRMAEPPSGGLGMDDLNLDDDFIRMLMTRPELPF